MLKKVFFDRIYDQIAADVIFIGGVRNIVNIRGTRAYHLLQSKIDRSFLLGYNKQLASVGD